MARSSGAPTALAFGQWPSLPNEASIRRLVGAILMEQTEEWAVQRGRYLTLETLAPVCDDVMVSLPAAQRD